MKGEFFLRIFHQLVCNSLEEVAVSKRYFPRRKDPYSHRGDAKDPVESIESVALKVWPAEPLVSHRSSKGFLVQNTNLRRNYPSPCWLSQASKLVSLCITSFHQNTDLVAVVGLCVQNGGTLRHLELTLAEEMNEGFLYEEAAIIVKTHGWDTSPDTPQRKILLNSLILRGVMQSEVTLIISILFQLVDFEVLEQLSLDNTDIYWWRGAIFHGDLDVSHSIVQLEAFGICNKALLNPLPDHILTLRLRRLSRHNVYTYTEPLIEFADIMTIDTGPLEHIRMQMGFGPYLTFYPEEEGVRAALETPNLALKTLWLDYRFKMGCGDFEIPCQREFELNYFEFFQRLVNLEELVIYAHRDHVAKFALVTNPFFPDTIFLIFLEFCHPKSHFDVKLIYIYRTRFRYLLSRSSTS